MKKQELPAPTTADGAPLTDELQDEFACSVEMLPFSHFKRDREGNIETNAEGENIVLARHAMLVDPGRIDSADLIAYQRKMAAIVERIDETTPEVEQMRQAEASESAETALGLKSREIVLLAESLDLYHEQRTAKAELLAKAVTEWTLRRNGAPIEAAGAFLLERTGPGPDAFDALDEWYFPFSKPAEAETGKSEAPNTTAP